MSILGVLFLFSMSLLPSHFPSYPLSNNSKTEKPCSYRGKPLCEIVKEKDFSFQQQFRALNGSNPACASLILSFLCSTCHELYPKLSISESDSGDVSVICSSIFSMRSNQSQVNFLTEVCTKMWDACGNISLINTLFASSIYSDKWQSRRGSHQAFGRTSDETSCLDDNIKTSQPQKGLCLEKIGNGAYINMVPHPDGSNRVFISSQQGKVWLADIPDVGSSRTLGIVDSESFLDLTGEVASGTISGLLGMAFHPNFVSNGRFFMSFNCDKMKQPGCIGRCSCNTDVDCDPSKLIDDNEAQPCQYHTVVAEYSVNDTVSNPSLAKKANPVEVRRIFTIGLPYGKGHAGQIIFGPSDDRYLFIMTADGSIRDDPYNFAQNKKSLLGKILRIDVDHMPSAKESNELGLWGNYSIPKDNPYVHDKDLEPEIWALGFRNPWRCSFDSERPSYFLCGDSGQDQYEEVDFIVKGGNYGWRVYEGPMIFHPNKSPGGNTSASSINPIFPVMGYYHSKIDRSIGSAAIIGGYFYRSMTDPCMYGRYFYMDLYAGALFAGTEKPENSRNFTTSRIPFRCAHDSPIQCSFLPGDPQPNLGYIFSLGEDNSKDIYILTSAGVYRVARPSRCNFTCSKEIFKTRRAHSSSSTCKNSLKSSELLFFFFSTLFLVLNVFL